ncbi:hypothetical protein [Amycolatopsis pittospori]|uniref:hypothetical protein n=1 Tax=Amycolatopsis pittospori TaxID=2749434 RepID=UPI0015F0FCD4|nr:hypothetical protein [Amycolatopsis pittospori]
MKKKIAAAAAVMGALASTIAFAQPASAGVDPRYYPESSWSTEGDCLLAGHSGKEARRWSAYFCDPQNFSWVLYIKK